MEKQIILNLGQGDWQTGFKNVTAQLWENDQKPVQFIGSLPPSTHLSTHYQHWRKLYDAITATRSSWRRSADKFEFDMGALTNVSEYEMDTLCLTLQTELNQWLLSPTFAPVEQCIRTHLVPEDSVRVMLIAHEQSVLRFPWQLWKLFEDYSNAELSLSLPTYSRSLKQATPKSPGTIKILAILGNDDCIDVETDREILGQLPWAQVTLLAQPTLTDLQQHLWESSWDVLFFAGHSSSQGKGSLQVNPTESLTIEQLKYALRRAIANGLQLAILNSCDGLGLAWELADLSLPQTIVMREPVPDAIAHKFLKGFLTTFSQGRTLYSAVREAREKLHGLTKTDACAAWLPVIVQNPAEDPPTWASLAGHPPQFSTSGIPHSFSPISSLPPSKFLVSSLENSQKVWLARLMVAAVVFALRWAGGLQGLELWAYDALMKLRPFELPDARLVVVTINERDIQSQTSLERRGSLSDETLQKTLEILSSYNPRVIGLDIYRDFPARTAALADSLSQSNVIGICKSIDPIVDEIGIGAPPEMAVGQIGFSDFMEETDGILRRQLLTLSPEPVSPCNSSYGFATLLALRYLSEDGIQSSFTSTGDLQLGDKIIPRLGKHPGGLRHIDNRGAQLLLNYRSLSAPSQIAANVPLQKLLDGQVNSESLRDRIVLIGVTAPSGDYWSTIYGEEAQHKTSGVFMQAQMTSQIISAVLDDRPLIWMWPQWVEASSVVSAVIVGSLLTYRRTTLNASITCLLVAVGLSIGAWIALLAGGWLPLIPVLVAFAGGSLSVKLAAPSFVLLNHSVPLNN